MRRPTIVVASLLSLLAAACGGSGTGSGSYRVELSNGIAFDETKGRVRWAGPEMIEIRSPDEASVRLEPYRFAAGETGTVERFVRENSWVHTWVDTAAGRLRVQCRVAEEDVDGSFTIEAIDDETMTGSFEVVFPDCVDWTSGDPVDVGPLTVRGTFRQLRREAP